MPLYEYRCAECDKGFEKYVRAWSEAVRCPDCASESVEKQLSTFAFTAGAGSSVSPAGGCGCGRGGCGCRP